ncbi:MAG: glycosyl hydrolase [Planctomycetes bacterium]|nr:glycosyl hydrolase [Planctomycetota bacterium]
MQDPTASLDLRRRVAAAAVGVVVSAAVLAQQAQPPAAPPAGPPAAVQAAAAQRGLLEFWDERSHLFRRSSAVDADQGRPFDYWWQAHAIDALVDAFERTRDRRHLQRARELWRGVVAKNGGPTNDYYDDMLWMALALDRLAAAVTAEQRRALRRDVATLWRDVRGGWNDQQGGGIAWRKSQRDYKNTPANAPAVILGARLARGGGDADDLDFARRVYDWLDAHLVDPETGFVWDGVNRRGDGRVDRDWAFTYNQGLRIGAAVELFRSSGEQRFLDDARRTFAATTARLCDERGVLKEHGNGDGALFKGVLLRYVGEWLTVDAEAAGAGAPEFVQRQTEALWSQLPATARDGSAPLLFGPDWRQASEGAVELAAQLSAVMLFEQAARLAAPPRGTR